MVVINGAVIYLYVNGLSTSKEIQLQEGVVLAPVSCAFRYDKISELLDSDVEYAAAIINGMTVASQIRISASTEEEAAVVAWNSLWDGILLGAILHCEVMANIQCDMPVEKLEKATYINVMNYAFRAVFSETYHLTEDDEQWLALYYTRAHDLLEKEPYKIAVHAMASYKWHSMPRVQLAILWSGIEALFEVSTEISFRISLCIANFLAGEDAEETKKLFERTRKLYSARSNAVHGGKIKGEINDLVSESAKLLNRLIRRCAETGALPVTEILVFPSGFGYST